MVTINFTLSDNLNLSYDGYRTNDYVFSTAANAATIEVRLKVNSGEGSLYLDNVELKETIQIDQIYLDGQTTLSVGDTTTITPTYTPENYTDLSFHWTSLDETIATVDENGTVTATGVGSTYVGLVSDSDLVAESMIRITVSE